MMSPDDRLLLDSLRQQLDKLQRDFEVLALRLSHPKRNPRVTPWKDEKTEAVK